MARAPHPYVALIAARASEAGYAWWSSRHERLDGASFAAAFAGTGRRLGAVPVALSASEDAELARVGLPSPASWPLSELGRVALLVAICAELESSAALEVVSAQFKTGDNAERAAVLHALPLLPAPERFVELAIDACRTSVQSVFEAIACENPYPARFFPDLNFNQLVLKAFFTGIAVRRIVGLAARNSAELVRMANAYASERRAAGRSVPDDLSLVTAAPLEPRGLPGAKS